MYRKHCEMSYPSFVGMSLILVLLMLSCGDADASIEDQRSFGINQYAMWVAAVVGGCGMLVILVVIFAVSTFFLQRYERQRVNMLAPMLVRVEPPTVNVNDEPRQLTNAGPVAAPSVNGEVTGVQSLEAIVAAAEPLGTGHVYYNRGLDVDEAEPRLTTQYLDPGPIKIGATGPQSGRETSFI